MKYWSETNTKKYGGRSYSDPIFDTENIKFYHDPKFTQ